MNGIFEAAAEIQAFLQNHNWRFCIIGGLAVIRWGQPRATRDVDISLFVEFGHEEAYVNELFDEYEQRIPDAREFALSSRVALIQASNGTPVDIALAGFPYEEQFIQRATAFEYAPDVSLVTASAEDIVVLKAFASRHRDWDDVQGIAIRQMLSLDWDYVFAELASLCELKGDQEPVEHLRSIRTATSAD